MGLILSVLFAAVVLLLVARWLKTKKPAGSGGVKKEQPPVLGKNATRHSRSRRFNLDPLSPGDLTLQESNEVDPLTSNSSLSNKPVAEEKAPSDLIVVHAMAAKGRPYHGYDLLQALLANNLRFGDRKIFHRYETVANNLNHPLYSVASLNKPGTFDLPKMGSFSCDGLVFFVELKGLSDPIGALKLMLDSAEKLVATLGGHLADEARRLLTVEAVTHMREQARYYASSNAKVVVYE